MSCKESAFVAMHLLYKSPVTNQLQIFFCISKEIQKEFGTRPNSSEKFLLLQEKRAI